MPTGQEPARKVMSNQVLDYVFIGQKTIVTPDTIRPCSRSKSTKYVRQLTLGGLLDFDSVD